jgi:hypothetical protein
MSGGEMSFCIELNTMRGDVQYGEMSLPYSNAGRRHAGKRQAGKCHAGRHHRTKFSHEFMKLIKIKTKFNTTLVRGEPILLVSIITSLIIPQNN